MAQQIQTTLIDDLDPDQEATVTIAFALDGATYEIDLSDEHADELRDAFAPYVDAARRIGRSRAARAPRTAKRPTAAAPVSRDDSPDPGTVRAWAREHDIAVNERGRIKGAVLAQFLEATR